MSLHIFNIVQSWGQWIIDINDNDLPISLLLVQEGHDTKDLDLLDLAWGSDELADLADVQRVIVTFGLGLRVNNVRIFPGLRKGSAKSVAGRVRAMHT